LHLGAREGYNPVMNIKSAWILTALACAAAAVLLVSCETTRGVTLGRVLAAEAGQKSPENPPAKPPQGDKKGLEVISTPDRAEVWIDGELKGLTPLLVEDITKGSHRVLLRKRGYYGVEAWVEVKADYVLYQANLPQITGFLQLAVTPSDSLVTVGGTRASGGLLELPIGEHPVVVRAFGYKDYRGTATIMEKAMTFLTVTLEPAPFEITVLTVPKPAVNPDNPGLLGVLEVSFSVSGPGTGRVAVVDGKSAVVFSQELPPFESWDQSFSWDLRGSSGAPLPDGEYLLQIVARGDGADLDSRRETAVRIDRTLKVAARSVWSGSSGLMYAPVAEVLPPGDFQLSVLGGATVVNSLYRAPIQLGARIGLGNAVELDVSGGLIPSSVAIPFVAGIAARWNILSPHGQYGTGSAIEAKASLQFNPAASSVLLTDTFANFTGISLGMPFQITLGTLNLLASVGATASLWHPYGQTDPAPVIWLYLRVGLMLDLGQVTAGVSASTRTEPLPGGVSFLGSPVPFQAGVEVHWLIPNTRFVLSGMAAGEYEGSANYYFYGGGGLGFLY